MPECKDCAHSFLLTVDWGKGWGLDAKPPVLACLKSKELLPGYGGSDGKQVHSYHSCEQFREDWSESFKCGSSAALFEAKPAPPKYKPYESPYGYYDAKGHWQRYEDYQLVERWF